MNEVLLSALLGTLGGIIAAILSYLAARHTARQELKKSELAYRQKLDEAYLINARLAVEKLYVPLNANLTELTNAFEQYQIAYESDNQGALKDFQQACTKYISQIVQLFSNGQDAYLTHKLARRLQIFNNFIKNSIKAQTVVLDPHGGRPWRKSFYDWNRRAKIYEAGYRISSAEAEVDLVGWHLGIESAREILAAPVTSPQFKQQFLDDVDTLRLLIREVTLGTILPRTVRL